MLVSKKYKFVYIAPPKTGTTSMEAYLKEYYEAFQWKEYSFDIKKNKESCWRHIPDVPKKFVDYFIFATVKNPYDLVISLYMNDIKTNPKNVSFYDFVVNRVPKKGFLLTKYTCQNKDYTPPENCIYYKLNTFLKLENIQRDIERLPFYIKDTKIQLHNKSLGNKPFYTADLARIVHESHKEDFEMFKYSEPSWMPKKTFN